MLLLALCCVAPGTTATLVLDDRSTEYEARPHLAVLEDPTGELDLAAARDADAAGRFRPLGTDASNFGLTTSAWWVRLELTNGTAEARDFVLRQNYPLIDFLDVWLLDRSGDIESWHTGDRRPFSRRPIAHRDFLFPVALEAGETRVAYLRFASEGALNVGLSLYAPSALLSRVAVEHLAFGAYFGGFLLLAISIFLLYLLGRDRAFLYYLLYILSYASYMAQFNGLAYQFLWPELPDFSAMSQVVLLSSSLFFLLQFCRTLLDMPQVSPLLNRLAQAFQLVVLGCALAAPVASYGLLMKPLVPATLLSMLLVIAMGIAAHRSGQRAARFYLLAWSVFLLGVMAYMLKTVGLLPHNFLTQYGFQIGSFFEFVLLSVALGIRVQELRRQSQTDALTGLANRGLFDVSMREEFDRVRSAGGELAVLVLDVDHFKAFNDKHGHQAGDRVLREVALILEEQVQRPSRACRYGGEEFAVIVPGATGDRALALGEKLRRTIEQRLEPEAVTISVGVACIERQPFADQEALFRAADAALYEAKRRGRNRVEAAWEHLDNVLPLDEARSHFRA